MNREISYHFNSPIEAIDRLRVYAMPKGSVVDVAKIARHGNLTVYQDKAGKLYSMSIRGTCSASVVFGRGFPDDYVNAFAKLGMITHAQARQHLKLATEDDARHKQRQRAQDFIEAAHKIGLKLNKIQIKHIQKLRNPKN